MPVVSRLKMAFSCDQWWSNSCRQSFASRSREEVPPSRRRDKENERANERITAPAVCLCLFAQLLNTSTIYTSVRH
jgi:hypothetical protein